MQRNRKNSFKKLPWAFFIYLFLFTLAMMGCKQEGENKVTTELYRPVQVNISGNVIYKETGKSIDGLTIKIEARDYNGIKVDAATPSVSATSDPQGEFKFSKKVALNVDQYQYFLVITDERDTAKKEATGDANNYARHDTTFIYANRDQDLVFQDIAIYLSNAPYKTVLKGLVKGIGSGMSSFVVIPNAVVNLQSVADGSVPYSVRTKSDGTFTVENCVVEPYIMSIDATNVQVTINNQATAKAFVVESERISLKIEDERDELDSGGVKTGRKYIQLSTNFLMEQLNFDDLRMVLQWDAPSGSTDTGYDLDSYFSLGNDTCNINQLRGVENKLIDIYDDINPASTSLGRSASGTSDMTSASYLTVSPQSGFGLGSCYWPEFLGGEKGDENRISIQSSCDPNDATCRTVYNVSFGSTDYFIGAHEYDSSNGSEPEIISFYKEPMLRQLPANLAYYYDWQINNAGDTVRHYPIAIGVFTVVNNSASAAKANIFATGALVKVYQGNSRIGTFKLTNLNVAANESNTKTWTPLIVEYGFKRTNPIDPAKDIYFRVVPFESFDRLVSPEKYIYELVEASTAYDGTTGTMDSTISHAYAGFTEFDEVFISGCNDAGNDGCGTGTPDFGIWRKAYDNAKGMYLWRWLTNGTGADEFPRTAKINDMIPADGSILMAQGANIRDFWDPATPYNCGSNIRKLLYANNGVNSIIFSGTMNGLYGFDWNDNAMDQSYLCSNGTVDDIYIGQVTSIAESPEDNNIHSIITYMDSTFKTWVVAGADNGGGNGGLFFKDIDTPGTWTTVNFSANNANAPTSNETIYAMADFQGNLFTGTDKGLYYYLNTTDIGAVDPTHTGDTWYHIPTCSSLYSVNCVPQTSRVLAMAAFDEKLYIGTNQGIRIFSPYPMASLNDGVNPPIDVYIKNLEHFPTSIQVNGFLQVGTELYILTEGKGIFVIR